VVIVGAGFSGLEATKVLARSGAEVVLVDRNNYHTFIPMLYQVATALLEPQQVVYPLRRFLRRMPNTRFVMAQVKRIDFENQVLETDSSVISYDYLILATGSQSQFLGVPGASEYTLPMQTLQEALTLRNHILTCFERAVQQTDLTQRARLLTFVIVGGGATGVELAGALIELIRGSLAHDYPTLNMQQVQVILLQSADCLLADLPKRLSDYTCKRLRQMGVKVYLQGAAAAQNILRQMRGRSPLPFSYTNKGRLAIIGRNAGVGQIGTFSFTGFLAWFLWLYVHLCYLPGIRNRISVLFNWICSYFFGVRPAHLIFDEASIKTIAHALPPTKKE
jgi:NADH dehydrogenase FAD-containing subunit